MLLEQEIKQHRASVPKVATVERVYTKKQCWRPDNRLSRPSWKITLIGMMWMLTPVSHPLPPPPHRMRVWGVQCESSPSLQSQTTKQIRTQGCDS